MWSPQWPLSQTNHRLLNCICLTLSSQEVYLPTGACYMTQVSPGCWVWSHSLWWWWHPQRHHPCRWAPHPRPKDPPPGCGLPTEAVHTTSSHLSSSAAPELPGQWNQYPSAKARKFISKVNYLLVERGNIKLLYLKLHYIRMYQYGQDTLSNWRLKHSRDIRKLCNKLWARINPYCRSRANWNTYMKLDSEASATLQGCCGGVQVLAPEGIKLFYPQGAHCIIASMQHVVFLAHRYQVFIHM